MKYHVVFSSRASRELRKIALPMRERILNAVNVLADNPRPFGCKKLTGRDECRIRVGDYRIVYEIHDNTLTVIVMKVGHRKDIYR